MEPPTRRANSPKKLKRCAIPRTQCGNEHIGVEHDFERWFHEIRLEGVNILVRNGFRDVKLSHIQQMAGLKPSIT